MNKFFKKQRHLLSRTSRPISYKWLSAFGLVPAWFERVFCGLPAFWSKLKVPQGGLAESPMVFTYKTPELIGPESGWWVVTDTEVIVKTAAFVLMELYDGYWIWALSPHTWKAIDTLGLDVAFGNRKNTCEIQQLAKVIGNPNFLFLPSGWTLCVAMEGRSPGRQDPGADFLYYDRGVGTRYHTVKQLS